MEHLEQSGTGGGNTNSPPTKGRRWCFTLNNWTDTELEQMERYFGTCSEVFIIGKEIGEDKKTPHLQAYAEFKNPVAFTSLKKKLPRAHIEKARGNRDANFKYCSKEGCFLEKGMMPFRAKLAQRAMDRYDGVVWRAWQQQVIDIIESPPDDRTVHWFWETTGNVGKSFLAKYIVLKYGAIIADGKKNDVFHQVMMAIDSEKEPRLIVLDIPRHNIEYVNYGVLEQLKNGLIYSGKYEGGQCAFPSPHVIVFANTPPVTREMSLDRWHIVNIDGNQDEY